MARAWISPATTAQPALLPADPADMLPADHLAWAVLAFVDELDLFAFEAAYRADGQGRQPYDPRMMTALILYCYARRKTSGEDIAEACVDDWGAILICRGLRPDRSTIDGFRRRHRGALAGL